MSTEQEVYKEIIGRFPSGRLSSYLSNNTAAEKDSVIEQLVHFTKGTDGNYTDDKSKEDAQNFIDRLKALE